LATALPDGGRFWIVRTAGRVTDEEGGVEEGAVAFHFDDVGLFMVYLVLSGVSVISLAGDMQTREGK
jgi:hypothetical protein